MGEVSQKMHEITTNIPADPDAYENAHLLARTTAATIRLAATALQSTDSYLKDVGGMMLKAVDEWQAPDARLLTVLTHAQDLLGTLKAIQSPDQLSVEDNGRLQVPFKARMALMSTANLSLRREELDHGAAALAPFAPLLAPLEHHILHTLKAGKNLDVYRDPLEVTKLREMDLQNRILEHFTSTSDVSSLRVVVNGKPVISSTGMGSSPQGKPRNNSPDLSS